MCSDIQLAEHQPLIPVFCCYVLWHAVHLLRKQFVHTLVSWLACRGLIPFIEYLCALCFAQERQLPNVFVWICHNASKQILEVAQQARDSILVEEISVAFQQTLKLAIALNYIQSQIKIGRDVI